MITLLHPDGEPKSPKGVKTTVVNQCGCYVRENIPISFKLWKKTKSTDNDADIVPETEKQMLWEDVKQHFSFPEDKEEIFKDWVMKKRYFFPDIQEELEQRLHKEGSRARLREALQEATSFFGMHLCSTNCPRPVRKGQHKPKECEQKDTLSSS